MKRELKVGMRGRLVGFDWRGVTVDGETATIFNPNSNDNDIGIVVTLDGATSNIYIKPSQFRRFKDKAPLKEFWVKQDTHPVIKWTTITGDPQLIYRWVQTESPDGKSMLVREVRQKVKK